MDAAAQDRHDRSNELQIIPQKDSLKFDGMFHFVPEIGSGQGTWGDPSP